MTHDLVFKNIWILYPNCSDLICKSSNDQSDIVGKFTYNLAKYLVRNEYHVIILTSHCPNQMQELFNQGLTFFEKNNFTAKGSMFSHYFDSTIEYDTTFYSGILNGVRLVLFYGLNEETQKLLSHSPLGQDSNVKLFIDKVVLLSRIIKEYVNYIGPIEFPDIIHYVNTVFVPAVITLKTEFSYVGKKVGIIFQHIKEPVGLPIKDMKEFLLDTCKIENTPHRVYHRGHSDSLNVEEVVNLVESPELTRIGAIEADLILLPKIDEGGDLDKILLEKAKIVAIDNFNNSDTHREILDMYSHVIRNITSL